MRVDLTDTSGFELIPAGRYNAVITDGEIRESTSDEAKHPGSEYINWELTISEGDYEGRKQWTNTPISHGTHECDEWGPNALIGIKALLAATGKWSDEDLAGALDFEIDDVLGSTVGISVVVRDYRGDDVNNVRRVRAPFADVDEDASLLPG